MVSRETLASSKPVPPMVHRTSTSPQPVGELSPLAYMLAVINDPSAAQTRRDRLAVAAAPYCHARPMPVRVSKKAAAAKAAKQAGAGTEWEGDFGDWPPQ